MVNVALHSELSVNYFASYLIACNLLVIANLFVMSATFFFVEMMLNKKIYMSCRASYCIISIKFPHNTKKKELDRKCGAVLKKNPIS